MLLKMINYNDDLDIFNKDKWIKYFLLDNMINRIIHEVKMKEITIGNKLLFNNNIISYHIIYKHILKIYNKKMILVKFDNFVMKFVDKSIWPYIIQELSDIVCNIDLDDEIKDGLNNYLLSNLIIA